MTRIHMLATAALCAVFLPTAALAVDGSILINQATVLSSGGFPYTISQAGSYRLSSNLIVTNTGAIKITAQNVTLDLNGFAILCTGCSGVPGIQSTAQYTIIRNGTVSGFGGTTGTPYAIYLLGNNARIDSILESASGSGLFCDSGDCTVSNSSAVNNAQYGVYCGGTLSVSNSSFSNNPAWGVTGSNVTITGSTFVNNGQGGTNLRGGVYAYAGIVTNSVFVNNVFSIASIGTGGAIGHGWNAFAGTLPNIGSGVISFHTSVCSSGPC